MILIICSADPLKKSPEIQVSSTSCGSLHDAKIGQHWEGFSSCRAWEETIERVGDSPDEDEFNDDQDERNQ